MKNICIFFKISLCITFVSAMQYGTVMGSERSQQERKDETYPDCCPSSKKTLCCFVCLVGVSFSCFYPVIDLYPHRPEVCNEPVQIRNENYDQARLPKYYYDSFSTNHLKDE